MTMDAREMIAVMQLRNGANIIRAEYVYGGIPDKDFRTRDSHPSATAAQSRRGSFEEEVLGMKSDPTGYCFKNVLGFDLEVGDTIVCHSRDGMALLRVTDSRVMPNMLDCGMGDLKHVVCKVDMAEYRRILESENEAIMQLSMSVVDERLEKFKAQVGASTISAVSGILGAPARPPMGMGDDDLIDTKDTIEATVTQTSDDPWT